MKLHIRVNLCHSKVSNMIPTDHIDGHELQRHSSLFLLMPLNVKHNFVITIKYIIGPPEAQLHYSLKHQPCYGPTSLFHFWLLVTYFLLNVLMRTVSSLCFVLTYVICTHSACADSTSYECCAPSCTTCCARSTPTVRSQAIAWGASTPPM